MNRILFTLLFFFLSITSAFAGLNSIQPKLGTALVSVNQDGFDRDHAGVIAGMQLNFDHFFLHGALIDEFDLHSKANNQTYVTTSMVNLGVGVPYRLSAKWELFGIVGYERWESKAYLLNSHVGSDEGYTPWFAVGLDFHPFWKAHLIPQLEFHQDVSGSRMTFYTLMISLEF